MGLEKQVKIFKALGDPTRLKIVNLLSEKELCVCEIIPATGKSQPTTSSHLKVLYEAGIVKSRRDGLSVYYRLADRKVLNLVKAVDNVI